MYVFQISSLVTLSYGNLLDQTFDDKVGMYCVHTEHTGDLAMYLGCISTSLSYNKTLSIAINMVLCPSLQFHGIINLGPSLVGVLRWIHVHNDP